jgi:uncharacterized protein YdgA (DUF945 family)
MRDFLIVMGVIVVLAIIAFGYAWFSISPRSPDRNH